MRERIKRDREREGELRQLMLADPAARMGNSYVAEVQILMKQRTDLAELKKMHPDVVSAYTFPQSETHVVLRGVTEDGEILSLRKVHS